MLEFLNENLGTILVSAVVVLVLVLAFMKIRRDKKKGISCGCGCGCSGCPSQGMCHSKEKSFEDKKSV